MSKDSPSRQFNDNHYQLSKFVDALTKIKNGESPLGGTVKGTYGNALSSGDLEFIYSRAKVFKANPLYTSGICKFAIVQHPIGQNKSHERSYYFTWFHVAEYKWYLTERGNRIFKAAQKAYAHHVLFDLETFEINIDKTVELVTEWFDTDEIDMRVIGHIVSFPDPRIDKIRRLATLEKMSRIQTEDGLWTKP